MEKGRHIQMPQDGHVGRSSSTLEIGLQPSLIPARITTQYPHDPIGKDYAFRCECGDEGTFHCKTDNSGKLVRANEWISQSLADHLGIAVPMFRVVENGIGDTFFGSRETFSTALTIDVKDFLTRPQADELGRRTDWLGRYLWRVLALDFFLNNQDRNLGNFVFIPDGGIRRLCAIDFADADLKDITSGRFPIASCNTIRHGKFLEKIHGSYLDSALEMIDRIGAVPRTVIEGILRGMPDEWMADDEQSDLIGAWSSKGFTARLSELRTGLTNGSLF